MTGLRRITWALAAATLGLYLAIVLWSLPIIAADAGGRAPFDLRPPGYSPDEARGFLAAPGETGHAHYEGPQRLLDRIYPPVLAVTLILAFWQLFARRAALGLGPVAALGAWFDLRENAAVADLPAPAAGGIGETAVGAASRLPLLRSAANTPCFPAVLIGAARVLWRRQA